MIWRKSVQTRLIQPWSLPDLPLVALSGEPFNAGATRLITFGWSMESLAAQEVWKRLAIGDFGPEGWHRGMILSGWEDELRTELLEAVSPSERASFVLILDREGILAAELQPEPESLCGAWHPQGRLLALGMATERAWEAMEASLRGCEI